MVKLENQVFKDLNSKGKDRKWRERKLKNIELAERLQVLNYRSYKRVYECAEVLKFIEQEDGIRKLYQSYFCKNKLCPICNWRRSMKYSYQAELVVDEAIKRHPKGRFLFLTLTIKNVEGDKLDETLKAMTEAFRRLMMYKKVDKNMIGYLRATEVTYSQDREDYHPHLHVLLFVKASYFNSSDSYLKQDEWQKLWGKALKLNYTPVVDIRAVKDRKGEGLKKAVLETSKYPVKPFDYEKDKDGNKIILSEEEKLQITDDLFKGLYRKRQIGFGKLFKEIKQEMNFDDLENGDLVHTSDDKETAKGTEIIAIWNWQRQNYFLK